MSRVELGVIRRAANEKLLPVAIFFGRTQWTEDITRSLDHTPEEQRKSLMDAHLAAAGRSRIIYGNYERERLHHEEYLRLRRKSNQQVEPPQEINEPVLPLFFPHSDIQDLIRRSFLAVEPEKRASYFIGLSVPQAVVVLEAFKINQQRGENAQKQSPFFDKIIDLAGQASELTDPTEIHLQEIGKMFLDRAEKRRQLSEQK